MIERQTDKETKMKDTLDSTFEKYFGEHEEDIAGMTTKVINDQLHTIITNRAKYDAFNAAEVEKAKQRNAELEAWWTLEEAYYD